ncbi:MAG: UDP-glucose 4-epimerase GalE [Pseudomonadota bacterium]
MNRVLVTGGAGYIGSHTSAQLVDSCDHLVVLDNLYSGHRWAVPEQAEHIEGDIRDRDALVSHLSRHRIDTVIHFAGHIEVNESVTNPAKYYDNNVVGSLRLLEACRMADVSQFVFSSSAAVYGIPESRVVDETTVPLPINPYGRTKLITEWTLHDMAAASDGQFRYVALRYFNVAGASDSGLLGQATPAATHLIKVACQAACGLRDKLTIFGDDYPTEDGTCIRDYIHVEDLARAHVDALAYLNNGGTNLIANCGYGNGYSVKQVIDTFRDTIDAPIDVVMGDRRAGDPPQLVASNSLIRERLGWMPTRDNLAAICRSAYDWEVALQNMN